MINAGGLGDTGLSGASAGRATDFVFLFSFSFSAITHLEGFGLGSGMELRHAADAIRLCHHKPSRLSFAYGFRIQKPMNLETETHQLDDELSACCYAHYAEGQWWPAFSAPFIANQTGLQCLRLCSISSRSLLA